MTATAALEEMKKASHDDERTLVLLGTSGCGKTRTCFETLCATWGIYFVVKGDMGSRDITIMKVALTGWMTEDFQKNRNLAEHYTRCMLLARLIILDYCVTIQNSFTPRQWLLIQVAQRMFSTNYNYDGDIFSELMSQFFKCASSDVIESILVTYKTLFKRLCFTIFPIILDEAQALDSYLTGNFKSTSNPSEDRSLLSPVLHGLRETTISDSTYCIVPCGSGLGLLKLKETLVSGIAREPRDIRRFTDFGGWRDADHVAGYAKPIIDLEQADINALYKRFPGRFRPIVTCIEKIITGSTLKDAIETTWISITQKQDIPALQHQSIYYHLDRFAKERPNVVNGTVVLELFKNIALTYFYTGAPHLFSEAKDMTIVELGLAQLRRIDVPNPDPGIMENMPVEQRMESGIDDVLAEERAATYKDGLRAVVEEPMVYEALRNYFSDNMNLPSSILSQMATANDPSAEGTFWQRYMPAEFLMMFDGTKVVSKLPMFDGIKTSDIFNQTATVIQPSLQTQPVLKLFSNEYNLGHYLREDSSSRSVFFSPENSAGPDLVFFIKFQDGREIPVIVQLKLRQKIEKISTNTTDPRLLYNRRDGKQYDVQGRIKDKMLELCRKNGVLRVFVAYPGKVNISKPVNNENIRELRNCSVIAGEAHVIIDGKNADKIFAQNHLAVLKELKKSTKRNFDVAFQSSE